MELEIDIDLVFHHTLHCKSYATLKSEMSGSGNGRNFTKIAEIKFPGSSLAERRSKREHSNGSGMSGSGNGRNFTLVAEIVFSIAIDRKELEKWKLVRKWNEWKWKWCKLHFDRRDRFQYCHRQEGTRKVETGTEVE